MSRLVVNTRPLNQSAELTTLLKSAGFDVQELPGLEIELLDCRDEILAVLQTFSCNDIVALTSANALKALEQDERVKQELRRLVVASVGRKTKLSLEKSGIEVRIVPSNQRSEGLAEMIEQYVEQHGAEKILYLSGSPNTGLLANRLSKQRGFKEIETYRSFPRSSLADDIINCRERLEQADSFVFMSRATLFAIDKAACEQKLLIRHKRCVVLSENISEAAVSLGYDNVSVAYDRSDEAIVSTLVSLSSAG